MTKELLTENLVKNLVIMNEMLSRFDQLSPAELEAFSERGTSFKTDAEKVIKLRSKPPEFTACSDALGDEHAEF